MIQLSNLTKSYSDRILLDNVTWQITPRERVGLCGPNGAGKTTLLRLMAGHEEPDSGAILKPAELTVGYLPQDGLTHAGRTVFDEATSAFVALLAMKTEMHALEKRLGDPSIPEPEHDAMLARYSDLQDRFRMRDGYSIDLKTATVLQGLGFVSADFDRPTETFSGGWQMRLALAKLLLGQPNLLLLDEPTNHLDLEARNWLETYLNGYPYAVILVSHDRFFLDAVVTRIADLTLRTLTDYYTNYSGYLVEHRERIEALRKAKREQDEEIARVKMFIDRFRYQATKASQVQSRVKMLEKVKPIEVPPERKKIHFDFPASAKSGRTVLELKRVRKAYDDLIVFDDLHLHIERGDRIALVGPNGAGKSTLMRMLSGDEAPTSGQRVEGHNVVMQSFAQDEAKRMDPAPTVYETIASGSPTHMVPTIRNILGGFLFSGRRRLQAGARAVRRRAHAAGGRAHAVATLEHALARRANQPSRSRLEGGAARRAHRLRRHAPLRLARPILRGASGDEDHRSGQRHSRGLSGQVRGVPVAQRASAGDRAYPQGGAPQAGRPPPRPSEREESRRPRAAHGARRAGATDQDRRARSAHRRHRARHPRDRTRDGLTPASTTTAPPHSRSSTAIRR